MQTVNIICQIQFLITDQYGKVPQSYRQLTNFFRFFFAYALKRSPCIQVVYPYMLVLILFVLRHRIDITVIQCLITLLVVGAVAVPSPFLMPHRSPAIISMQMPFRRYETTCILFDIN